MFTNDPFSLHAMAARGNLHALKDLLAQPEHNQPNAPDAEGRTAIFYAQVHGHAEVVTLLEQHGWTRMPEGNLWRGPGGRAMWWSSGHWATARPLPSMHSYPANVYGGASSSTAKAEPQMSERTWRMTQRQQRRQYEYRNGLLSTHGPKHKLYMRKAVGGRAAANVKPALNTRDFAEAYAKPDERTLVEEQRRFLAHEDEEDLAEAEAHDVEAAPPVAPRPTVADVARFVVFRKPTLIDGSWVVPEADDELSDEAVACLCAADGFASMLPASEALTAIPEAAKEDSFGAAKAWPALPERQMALQPEWLVLRTAAVDKEAFSDVGFDDDVSVVDSVAFGSELDSEVASLVDAEEPAPAAAEPASASGSPSRGVWGGAASTKAVVGFAAGTPAVFKPCVKAPAVVAAASAEAEVTPPTPALATKGSEEDDLDLSDSAGLKDASHRARGSHSDSAKAVEKRTAQKEKRVAQRGR